jgi:hypothetical protein
MKKVPSLATGLFWAYSEGISDGRCFQGCKTLASLERYSGRLNRQWDNDFPGLQDPGVFGASYVTYYDGADGNVSRVPRPLASLVCTQRLSGEMSLR